MNTRGRLKNKDKGREYPKSKSKSRIKHKYFCCHKEWHFKKNYFDHKKKNNEKSHEFGDISITLEKFEDSKVLSLMMDYNRNDWILSSSYSYHMTPNKCWFETYENSVGGVIVGNNVACKVIEIWTIKIKIDDRMIRNLKNGMF